MYCTCYKQLPAPRTLRSFSLPSLPAFSQVNLEYLGRVVFNSEGVLYPDSLVGTDSHTTMINGLGIAGWGKSQHWSAVVTVVEYKQGYYDKHDKIHNLTSTSTLWYWVSISHDYFLLAATHVRVQCVWHHSTYVCYKPQHYMYSSKVTHLTTNMSCCSHWSSGLLPLTSLSLYTCTMVRHSCTLYIVHEHYVVTCTCAHVHVHVCVFVTLDILDVHVPLLQLLSNHMYEYMHM